MYIVPNIVLGYNNNGAIYDFHRDNPVFHESESRQDMAEEKKKRGYSQAQNRATRKYQKAHLAEIKVWIPIGKKEYYREAAKALDMSMNQLAIQGMDMLIAQSGIAITENPSPLPDEPVAEGD